MLRAPTSSDALLVFLKAPTPGRVKTRLASQIGVEAAAEQYRLMATAVAFRVMQLQSVEVRLVYEPDAAHSDTSWLGLDAAVPWHAQVSGDLGVRLKSAIRSAFLEGFSRVVTIGSDSPDLPLAYIEMGFRALRRADVVVGPTEDGGYYLIGLTRPIDEVFEGVPWSVNSTFQATLDRAAALGLNMVLLPPWYDIDDGNTLRRWAERPVTEAKRAKGDRNA